MHVLIFIFTCTYFGAYAYLSGDYTCSLYRLRRGFEFRKRRLYFNCVYNKSWVILNFDVVSLYLFDIFLIGMTLFATFVPINKSNR